MSFVLDQMKTVGPVIGRLARRAPERCPVAMAGYEVGVGHGGVVGESAKRAMLYSLYSAKRQETRAKRVADALAVLEGSESLGREGGQ